MRIIIVNQLRQTPECRRFVAAPVALLI